MTSVLEKIPVAGPKLIDKISRTKQGIKQLLIPGMLFEDMGITYLGPVDGHDLRQLCRVLKEAKKVNHAVLVHVLTKKGKGYRPAEKNPAHFHGVEPFDIETGKAKNKKIYPTYTDVFSKELCRLAEADARIVAVTAAMPDGTGLNRFKKQYPDRFFDVGIAEAHGVTSAAGMAAAGLRRDLEFAVKYDGPVAVRYPRGTAYRGLKEFDQPLEFGKGEILYDEGREAKPAGETGAFADLKTEPIALLAVGSMVSTAEHIREKLKAEGYRVTLANGRFVKPVDYELVEKLAAGHGYLVTLEENVLQGGYGLPVTAYVHAHHPEVKVLNVALPDAYVEHGNVSLLREMLGIDSDSIIRRMKEELLAF